METEPRFKVSSERLEGSKQRPKDYRTSTLTMGAMAAPADSYKIIHFSGKYAYKKLHL